MATINSVSSALRLMLNIGTVAGKPVIKSVSISGIKSSAPADSLLSVATALGGLLAHPVAETRKYDTGLLTA